MTAVLLVFDIGSRTADKSTTAAERRAHSSSCCDSVTLVRLAFLCGTTRRIRSRAQRLADWKRGGTRE